MKISELIYELSIRLKIYGDIEVVKFSNGVCDSIDAVVYNEIHIPEYDKSEFPTFKDKYQDQTLDYKPYVVL